MSSYNFNELNPPPPAPLTDKGINVSSAEDLKIQYTQAIDRINDRFKLSSENE